MQSDRERFAFTPTGAGIQSQPFAMFFTSKRSSGHRINQGLVVQSIVSLTSSYIVKKLTVLVSTVSNSQAFLLKKNVSSIFFSKNINVYVIFNDQSFKDTSTNDIVSFEQLGPAELLCFRHPTQRSFSLGVLS